MRVSHAKLQTKTYNQKGKRDKNFADVIINPYWIQSQIISSTPNQHFPIECSARGAYENWLSLYYNYTHARGYISESSYQNRGTIAFNGNNMDVTHMLGMQDFQKLCRTSDALIGARRLFACRTKLILEYVHCPRELWLDLPDLTCSHTENHGHQEQNTPESDSDEHPAVLICQAKCSITRKNHNHWHARLQTQSHLFNGSTIRVKHEQTDQRNITERDSARTCSTLEAILVKMICLGSQCCVLSNTKTNAAAIAPYKNKHW